MNDKKYSLNISKSLNKRFRGALLAKFLRAIDEYKLIEKGDKICVALSGGKDSLLLAAQYHSDIHSLWQRIPYHESRFG